MIFFAFLSLFVKRLFISSLTFADTIKDYAEIFFLSSKHSVGVLRKNSRTVLELT